MSELTWEEHREQLNRQLRWQKVRNNFYSNICYHSKNAAAAQRAGARQNLDERRTSKIENRMAECQNGHDFYNKIVIPHDQAIKQAYKDGDAELHLKLLDEANSILKGMYEHTHLSLEYDEI